MANRWACIARMGGVGDNLIAGSVLRPLKKLGYMTEVITSELAGVVFHNNPYVDKLSFKGEKDIPGGDDWTKWFAARANEYDIFGHFSHSGEVRHALFPNSTAFWARPEYRRKMCAGSYLETAHDLVGMPYDFGPLFFPTEEELDRAQGVKDNAIKSDYITWVISGSRIDKIYPYATMAIPRLIKETGLAVVMVGAGGKQFAMATQIQDDVRRTNSSLQGLHLALSPDGSDPGGHQNWPIRRSLTQAMLGDLVITPDTGIAWACAMEDMPKIAMVSHASAENITKHWKNTTTLHADPMRVPCWPCHRLHNDISTCTPNRDGGAGAACISDISVEVLVQAVKKALAPPVVSMNFALTK